MIRLGIDEFTIVIGLTEESKELLKKNDWNKIAKDIIKVSEKALFLKEIFGKNREAECRLVAGYTTGFEYGYHPFYFVTCFNEDYQNMGVVIKFSASSWAYYHKKYLDIYSDKINVFNVISILREKLESFYVRFSRIDVFADYIDEGIVVDEIRQKLESKEYTIQFSTGKSNVSDNIAYTKNGIAETINVGSKYKGRNTFLRIYDKKIEQIKNKGRFYNEALKSKNWVRFENQIRGSYAHDVTDTIATFSTEKELAELIPQLILAKYSFVDTEGKLIKFSQQLRDCFKNRTYYFSASKYKDNSLEFQAKHLIKNAGLGSFIYKLYEIEPSSINKFFKYLMEFMKNKYHPSKDTLKWLKKHKLYYLTEGIEFLEKKGGK